MLNIDPTSNPQEFFRVLCETLAVSGFGDLRTDPQLRTWLLKELTKIHTLGNNTLNPADQKSLDDKLQFIQDILTGQASATDINDLLNNNSDLSFMNFNPENLLPNLTPEQIAAATPEHVRFAAEKLEKHTRLAFSLSTGAATRKQSLNFLIEAAEKGYKLPPQRHKEILEELSR